MAAPMVAVSLAMNAVSQVSSANAKADAMAKDAQLKRAQASELLSRASANAATFQRQGDRLRGSQVNALANSGVDVGSGSSLTMMEDTAHMVTKQIADMQREAQFKADQLNRGADVSMDLASETSLAGWLNAGGSILGGASKWGNVQDPTLGGNLNIGSGGGATTPRYGLGVDWSTM